MAQDIRILVVDDDERLRDIVSQVLSDDGHDVTSQANGVEALEAFRKKPFPLVITDIEMKRMSGIKLLQEVKKLHPDSEVILMTNYPSIETAIEALRHGACDYIMNAHGSLDLISSAVTRAVEMIKHKEEHRRLLDTLMKQNKELEQDRQLLKDTAVHDEATGLYNARYFHEALAVELNRSSHYHRKVSVVFLDFHWQLGNDRVPLPEEKTRLLRTASRVLKERLRKSDLLVRYRDESLAMLLPDTPREGTRCVIGSIERLLSEQLLQGPEGNITVSMKIAVYPEDGADSTALITHAAEG